MRQNLAGDVGVAKKTIFTDDSNDVSSGRVFAG